MAETLAETIAVALGVVRGFETKTCPGCRQPIVHKLVRYYARHRGRLAHGDSVSAVADHDAPCGRLCGWSPSAQRETSPSHHNGPGCSACTDYSLFF